MDERPRRPLRLLQNWKTALSWMIRGEASPPRNEPKTLVGVLAVLTMDPKVGDERLKSGFWKLGGFGTLYACAPTLLFPASKPGTLTPFSTDRSVLKYPGPVNWFLRCPPNDVGSAKSVVAEPPKQGVVVAALPQWLGVAGLTTSASIQVVGRFP